jgi:anaerobic ribonucleoside-triphosphate reductase activating protein
MSSGLLNVAQICPGTYTLGPGKRFALWVQGCPFSCVGCLAPDWIPFKRANVVDVETLGRQIVGVPDLEGLTISGGEPMMQAQALADLVDYATKRRPHLSVLVFSGFKLADLRKKANSDQGFAALLERIVVLIDGLYIEELNDGRGLRGSSNQRVHFLSERYVYLAEQLTNGARKTEMHLMRAEILLVGVPTAKSLQSFHLVVEKLESNAIDSTELSERAL